MYEENHFFSAFGSDSLLGLNGSQAPLPDICFKVPALMQLLKAIFSAQG